MCLVCKCTTSNAVPCCSIISSIVLPSAALCKAACTLIPCACKACVCFPGTPQQRALLHRNPASTRPVPTCPKQHALLLHCLHPVYQQFRTDTVAAWYCQNDRLVASSEKRTLSLVNRAHSQSNRVKRHTCCLIQEQNSWLGQDGPSYGNTLLLAPRQPHPPLPNLGAVALGELSDEVMRICNLGSLFHLSSSGQ